MQTAAKECKFQRAIQHQYLHLGTTDGTLTQHMAMHVRSATVYQLALTSLRNIIGQHDLDDVLQERDKINGLLRENIAGTTLLWGIRG